MTTVSAITSAAFNVLGIALAGMLTGIVLAGGIVILRILYTIWKEEFRD